MWNNRNKSFLILGVLAVSFLLLLWGPVVIRGHSAVIGGEKYWWLGDDAMISMRYARNFANGMGLVWNAGEKVEGYSNFLWTLYMSAIHLLPISISKISLVILITDLILSCASLVLLIRLVRILNGGAWIAAATAAAFVFNSNLLFWAASGFEVSLLTFLFLFALVMLLEDAQQNRPRWLTYLLIALLSLIRADAAILSGLLYLLALYLTKDRRTVFRMAIVSLVIPVSQEIFRLLYYHDWLPNTAYLKVTNWNGRIGYGIEYAGTFLKSYAVVIAFALIASLISVDRARRALALVIILNCCYIAYVGGDAFRDYRFFIPLIPLLAMLAFFGIRDLISRQSARLAFGIFLFCTTPLLFSTYREAMAPAASEIGNVEIGLLLKQNALPNSKVADTWAGQVLYFSNLPGVDLLGKSDAHIARMQARPEAAKPGHNKYDFDYSLGVLKPDFVISMFRLPVGRGEMLRKSKGDLAFAGQLYFNGIFQQHCLPNPVKADTWRTIFVCDWSQELSRKDHWTLLPDSTLSMSDRTDPAN
jgi:hypothetical protein